MRIDPKDKRLYVLTSSITEGDRVRKDYGDLKELADSISINGLIHPIVIDLNNNLVAGGRRFRAMRDILKLEEVAINYIECLDDATLRLLEAEENVRRKEMTWQERVRSIKLVHKHQALQAALKAESWTLEMTGDLLGKKSKAHISYCLMVADRLDLNDKEINESPNFSEALRILIKRKEDEVNASLARSTLPSGPRRVEDITALLSKAASSESFFQQAPSGLPGPAVSLASRPDAPEAPVDLEIAEVIVPLSLTMHKADCIAHMRAGPPELYDHVITDAPYAIDMEMLQQSSNLMDVSSTKTEHDVNENRTLLRDYLREAKRSVKDRGFVITWCDISQWDYLLSLANEFGLTPQRWPLIWHKTHTCKNEAASYNFTKNSEIALVLRKGNATLVTPQSSSIWQGTFALNERESYGHPFAKPAKLWQWVYSAVALRGQTVLDPFAGSGSSTIAAIASGLRPVSVELVDQHYNKAIVNVTNTYRSLHPKVRFI